jgi:hypothetical protein
MAKLELLSKNLINALETLLANQEFSKLVYYNVKNPLEQPNLADTSIILFDKLFPYPYDTEIQDTDEVKIHVYYPSGNFTKNELVENSFVFFDIVVAK